MVSNHEKPNSSKLLNLSQVFYCVGAITAPQIVSAFLYTKVSWQIILIIFSGFIFLIMCIFLLATRKENLMESALKPAEISKTPLLTDKMFYLLAAMLLIYVTFESILACWLSVYFEKGLSCPAHTSALMISVFWFGVILGRSAITVIPARLSLWPAIFSGTALVCVMSFFASLGFTPIIAAILVFLAGIGAGPLWPTTVAICHVARNRQKFTSSVIAIGALGVVIGSFLGGVIFKYMGFNMFFPMVMLGALLLLAVSCASKLCLRRNIVKD
jgi:fucose permease